MCWQCGLIDLGLNNGKLNCEGQTVAGNSSEGELSAPLASTPNLTSKSAASLLFSPGL